jgi:outer membrane receptor for ferrienterochelin and colicins
MMSRLECSSRLVCLCLALGLVMGLTPGDVEADELDALLEVGLEDLMQIQVVTPGRQKQSIAQAPANITAITAEMIERRGYRTLEEVLKDVPGFEFTTSQPSGEYPTHFIFRGISDLGQTKTLIMVDGIVQNDVSNGWARGLGFDLILSDVAMIEIVSGPGSALYGANAYAGLINIITKPLVDAPRGLQVEARAEVGENATLAPEFVATYRPKDDLRLRLAGRWYRTDGDGGLGRPDPGSYFTGNFEPDTVLTTEVGNVANERLAVGTRPIANGFATDIDDVYLRGRAEKGNFILDATFYDKEEGLGSEVVGYEYFANTNGTPYRVHHRGYSVVAGYTFDVTDSLSSRTRFYFRSNQILPETGFVYTYKYQSVDNGVDAAVDDKVKGYHGEGYVAGVDQQLNLVVTDNQDLVVGFQLEQEVKQYFGISLGPLQDSKSNVIASAYTSEEAVVQPLFFSKNAAVYVQDQVRLDENLTFTGGVRYDADDEYGQVLNPRASLVRSPERGMGFKLLYGQAFKSATVFEQFDEFRGNVQLEPEKIVTGELELNYRFTSAIARATVFYSKLTDLIAVAPNPDTTKVPIGPNSEFLDYFQNVGSASIRGLTVGADFRLRDQWRGFGHYVFTAGDGGDPLDNTARHKVTVGVDAMFLQDRLSLDLRANWRGQIRAPESNLYFQPKTPQRVEQVGYDYVTEAKPDGYMDGELLLNLTLTGYRLLPDRRLVPQLTIRNLFDTAYSGIGRQSGSGVRPVDGLQPSIQNPSGFIPPYHPQPGREWFFSVRYMLGA